MTLNSMTVNALYTKQWVSRWEDLCRDKFANELAIAELAKAIRDEFPRGTPGDTQFMQFIKRHLKGCRSDVMLVKAFSFDSFDGEDWSRYGGWQGIGFLLRLTKSQRRQLLSHLRGAGPYHYSTLVKYARSLGFEAANNGIGRPTREVTENKVRALGDWLKQLYATHSDLPPMPTEVRAALSRAQLMSIAPKLGARA